jgi:hypothetical protein
LVKHGYKMMKWRLLGFLLPPPHPSIHPSIHSPIHLPFIRINNNKAHEKK